MSSSRFTDLSYRELQALAVKYKVPGNTNKDRLIEFIECVENGDDETLEKLLEEHKRNKEKRRLEKKNENQLLNLVTSTPSISSSCGDDKDRYSPPSQAYNTWATAQKNLLNHEDQLQKFLLEQMQHYYNPQQRKRKHCELENAEDDSENSSIIDLRVSSDKSSPKKKFTPDLLNLKKEQFESTKKFRKNSLFSGGDVVKNRQMLDIHENVRRTMLLKKMLQAPPGVNLKNMTNVDNFYRFIVANKKLSDKNFYSNPSNDDSDTLTADSESNAEEHHQWNQNYYSPKIEIPDVKLPLLDINHPNLIKNQFNNAGYSLNQHEINNPLCNYNQIGEPQDCKNLYPNEVQENCKKWLSNSMDASNQLNPIQNMTNNNKNILCSGMYPLSQQNSTNNLLPDTTCYPTLIHQANQQDYPENLQTINNPERVRVVRTPAGFYGGYVHQNYPENNNNNVNPIMTNDLANCILQDKNDAVKDRRFYQYNQEVWNGGGNNGQDHVGAGEEYRSNVDNIWGTGGQRVNGYNFNENGYGNDYCSGNNQAGYYQGNEQAYGADNFEGDASGQQQGFMESTGSSDNTLNSVDSSSFSNDVLEPYWPRKMMPARNVQDGASSNSQIEHILNVRHTMDVDDSKLNQTSATYCYAAPILTPGPSLSSNCSQKIRLIAETRKHLFTTQYLLYNDSSTGLNLSNIDYLNKSLDKNDYQDVFMNQDDILSSAYWEYMNKNLIVNSDSEGPLRKDVWFSNHFDNDPINYSL